MQSLNYFMLSSSCVYVSDLALRRIQTNHVLCPSVVQYCLLILAFLLPTCSNACASLKSRIAPLCRTELYYVIGRDIEC